MRYISPALLAMWGIFTLGPIGSILAGCEQNIRVILEYFTVYFVAGGGDMLLIVFCRVVPFVVSWVVSVDSFADIVFPPPVRMACRVL